VFHNYFYIIIDNTHNTQDDITKTVYYLESRYKHFKNENKVKGSTNKLNI